MSNDTLMTTILPLIMSNKLNSILSKKSITPVNVFENLDSPEIQKNLKRVNKNKAGVYMIINLVNGKCYVGSASMNLVHTQFIRHMIYYLGNDMMAKAVQKYGLNNFAFIIIEYVDTNKINKCIHYLTELETHYLEMINPEYNILTVAGSSYGYKHSPEVLSKMKRNYSEEIRNRIAQLNKGKRLSESVIEQLKASALKRPPVSDETRIKLSLISSKSMYAISEKSQEEIHSVSMKEMAFLLKVSTRRLKRAITNNKLVKNNWRVSFTYK